MDKYLGDFGWNELTPNEQELIGFGLREVAERRPDWRTKEEIDSIARFVRFARWRREAAQRNAEES